MKTTSAEDKTLSKIIKYYDKKWEGTDPVKDTIRIYQES